MTQGLTRIWTSLAFAAVLALAVVWLGGANSTQAAGGGVSMSTTATVSPGGDATVDLVATPSACVPEVVPDSDPPIPGFKDCPAIWVINVKISDTSVVSVVDQVLFVDDPNDPNDEDPGDVCPKMAQPNGTWVISGCSVDLEKTPPFDNVKVLGGLLFTDTGKGLEIQTVLASMKFHAEGAVGQCADLTITVSEMVDPNSHDLSPTVTSGKICIAEGTQRVWGDVDCGGAVNSGDARKVILKAIGVEPLQAVGCPKIKDTVTVGGTPRVWGDVDCGGAVNSGDARKIILKAIGVEPLQAVGCPKIKDTVTVQ